MSFGLVGIPTTYGPNTTIGDPVLSVLLDFCQTVLNAHCGDAWNVVFPSKVSPRPVMKVFAFEPTKDTAFSDKDLPALFLWRAKTDPTTNFGQDLEGAVSTLKLLWIHPSGSGDALIRQSPFWNAIDKIVRVALVAGKDPVWQVPGDTYYSPDFYGSSLLYHTQCMRIVAGKSAPEKVLVETEGQRKMDASGYLGSSLELIITETAVPDTIFNQVAFAGGVSITLNGNSDDLSPTPLVLQLAQLGLRLNSIDVTTGPIAGGTSVTLTGTGFTSDTTVTFGGTAAEVTYVSLNELTVVTPAHAVGVVSIVATNLGDESFTLASIFTFA